MECSQNPMNLILKSVYQTEEKDFDNGSDHYTLTCLESTLRPHLHVGKCAFSQYEEKHD